MSLFKHAESDIICALAKGKVITGCEQQLDGILINESEISVSVY